MQQHIAKNNCYQQVNLALGKKYSVKISWVHTPARFYCQSFEAEGSLDEMAKMLREKYDSLSSHEMTLNRAEAGTECVAFYDDDGRWYRAKILETRRDKARIVYVDYGNTDIVPINKLKSPIDECYSIPIQGVCCCLKGSHSFNQEWPASVISLFEDVMAKPIVLYLINKEKDNDAYTADLSTNSCSSLSSEVSRLIKQSTNSFNNSVGYAKEQKERQERPSARGDSWADRKTGANKYDKGGHAVRDGSYSGGGDAWSEKGPNQSQDRSKSWKEKSNQKEYNSLKSHASGDGFSSSSESNQYNAVKKVELSSRTPPTSPQPFYIAVVLSPQSFFLHLVSEQNDLTDLATQLKSQAPRAPNLQNPRVNDQCVALFTEDGSWYRAIITDLQADTATVLFVDYGNTASVNISNIKSLSQELSKKPVFAFECKLRGVAQFTAEDTSMMNQLASEKGFTVTFHSSAAPFEVSMIDDDNIDILDHIPSGRLQSSTAIVASVFEEASVQDVGMAYISHVESPGEFYLQYHAQTEALANLMAELQTEAISAQPLVEVSVGGACAAVYSEDKQWYRAQIISVEQSRAQALVRFIDYGNSEDVDLTGLKQITSLSPPFAVQCQLEPTMDWDDEATKLFTELTCDKDLQVKLNGTRPPFTATLVDEDVIINEHFKATTTLSPKQASDAGNKMEASEQSYPEIDMSSIPSSVQAYVSHIDSPSNLYIQLQQVETELETMGDSLHEKYSSATEKDHPCTFIVGMACCARYTEDEGLYRARITEVTDDGVAVQFVDYGNYDNPSLDNVYSLTPDCPPLAIHCSLSDLEQPEGGWTDDMKAKLVELTSDKLLTVEILSSVQPCRIRIFENEQNLGVTLRELFPDIPYQHSVETEQEIPQEQTSIPTYSHYPIPDSAISSVYISFAESPSSFSVQNAGIEEEIETLQEQVEVECAEALSLPMESAVVGTPCCAKSAEDDSWYRAIIIGIKTENPPEPVVIVRFVDYGNSEEQVVSELKVISDDLRTCKPMLAMMCILSDVSHQEGWNEEEIEAFNSLEELSMEVVNAVTPLEVILKDDSGESMAKKLFPNRVQNEVTVPDQLVGTTEEPEIEPDNSENVEVENAEDLETEEVEGSEKDVSAGSEQEG